MNCSNHRSRIALHVADDLPARAVRKLERHLDTCGDCRKFADGVARTRAAIQRAARSQHANSGELAELRANLRARLAEERAREQGRGFAWRRTLAWGVTAMLLLAVSGIGGVRLVQGGSATPPPEPVAAALPKPAPPQYENLPATGREPRTPTKIIIVTDNPSLVVYWLGSEEDEYALPTV